LRVHRHIQDGAALGALLNDIELAADSGMTAVLAIDDLDGLQRAADGETLHRLHQLVQARRSGLYVLLVGSSSSLGASYDGVGHAIREAHTGFLVGGSEYEDMQVLGISVPHAEASQGLPVGRGFYARRKRYIRVKVAAPPNAADLTALNALTPAGAGSTAAAQLVQGGG